MIENKIYLMIKYCQPGMVIVDRAPHHLKSPLLCQFELQAILLSE